MKNIKNLLAAATLIVVLLVGTSFAGTGLYVSDANGGSNTNSCTEKTSNNTSKESYYNSLTEIVVQGVVGIVVKGVTGIVVRGAGQTQTNCGILMSD